MIVVIDAGNTRIKWGAHDGRDWLANGALATADVAQLAEAADEWPRGARIVLCNVAGAAVGQRIEEGLRTAGHADLHRFHASAACAGVRNGYAEPERLGADRWAALLGAHVLAGGKPCLVVSAGTATTIDRLDADGTFPGGVILPGFDMMRSALAGNTAQLPLVDGEFIAPPAVPTRTGNAIVTGCMHAQLGAIERLFAPLAATPGALCLLTGGGAPRLLPALRLPVRHEARLVLAGLVRYALSI